MIFLHLLTKWCLHLTYLILPLLPLISKAITLRRDGPGRNDIANQSQVDFRTLFGLEHELVDHICPLKAHLDGARWLPFVATYIKLRSLKTRTLLSQNTDFRQHIASPDGFAIQDMETGR